MPCDMRQGVSVSEGLLSGMDFQHRLGVIAWRVPFDWEL